MFYFDSPQKKKKKKKKTQETKGFVFSGKVGGGRGVKREN